MRFKFFYFLASFVFLLMIIFPAAGQVATSKNAGPTQDQVLAEINLARSNPSAYAEFLVGMRGSFKGNTYARPGVPPLVTNEGVAAVDEAINYLRMTDPVAPVKLIGGMCKSAGDHVQDVVNNKRQSHQGTDGSWPEDRLLRYGQITGNGALAENIAYEAATARDAVIGFIIDDGFPSRGHRLNIFSSAFTVIGVGVFAAAEAPPTCVVTFAEGYAEKAPVKSLAPVRP